MRHSRVGSRIVAEPRTRTARPGHEPSVAKLYVEVGLIGLLAASLTAGWYGIGAIPGGGGGSVSVASRTYVVQPGDTLWSIAERAGGSSDPRQVVLRMEAQLHGAAIQPGETVQVP